MAIEYKKVPIKDIFDKELLVTGITYDFWEDEKTGEQRPYILIYAEDKEEYIKFTTSSKVLLDKADKLKIPCRGKFIEGMSSSGRKYYNFVEEKSGNTT